MFFKCKSLIYRTNEREKHKYNHMKYLLDNVFLQKVQFMKHTC